MHAVTFQAPGEVRVDERPDPELQAPDDAIVRIEATGVCGSDLHIFHGRVPIEPGFTIGHEYVGTVLAAGDAVTSVAVGDRVLGCFQVACGTAALCRAGNFHKCERSRTFGHGAALGGLQGTQAEQALVPHANLTLRRVPEGMASDVALFAGDVMGTGYHAAAARCAPATASRSSASAPSGCAPCRRRASPAPRRWSRSTPCEARLEMARGFGAAPVHLTEEDPRAAVKAATDGRGVDVAIEAVGDPRALDLAIRVAASCGDGERRRRLRRALRGPHGPGVDQGARRCTPARPTSSATSTACSRCMGAGVLDPAPLVTHHMTLADAPEAYELYDRREALKIVLEP